MHEKFTLPQLPYDYDALEPHYDAETLEIHHSEHHQGYVNGLNSAIEALAEARSTGDFGSVKHLERELAFHGGGHALHSILWRNLSPEGGGRPGGPLASAIDVDWNDVSGRYERLVTT
jgi:superoxide dismutase, Fe-Mn family